MRRSLIFPVLLLTLWASSARAYTVAEGASRAELVSAYGYPLSQAKTGDREILNYREGSVVLEKGRVVEFRFTRGEPQLFHRLTPVPVQPAPRPVLSRPQEKAPAPLKIQVPVIQEQPAPPSPQPARAPQEIGFSAWTRMTILLGVFFFGIATLKITLAKKGRVRAMIPKTQKPVPLLPRPPVAPTSRTEITQLTRESLDRLEWRRFEELIHGYFETQNWKAQPSRVGADGGIDIFLYRPGEYKPAACVQCKAWHTYNVGVKPVRELLGVMTVNNIAEGYFVTTGSYTEEALAFKTTNLHLLSGHEVLNRFNALSSADHQKVVQHAFRGDFETPTCPSCDEKMILKQTETPFWGCRNFPRCRKTFKIRERA